MDGLVLLINIGCPLIPKAGQTFKMDQRYYPSSDNFEVWMRLPPIK